jgi:RNA-directed DNA polymerase
VVVSFDRISHAWLIQFVEHRIGDQRIVRLIQKWLKAGVMAQGRWHETEKGTPQGSVISPIPANLHLHYVLDLWVDQWRKKRATGDVMIVRHADDAVLGFQHREEAERFLEQLRERLAKFELELHSEKTRLIEFGRYAAERRKKRGGGKPQTFNFLGYTHFCGKSRPKGYFMVHRKTMGQRMAAKLKDTRQKLQMRRQAPVGETVKWLMAVVRGYFQYHAVPGNRCPCRDPKTGESPNELGSDKRLQRLQHGVREPSIRSSRRPGPGLRRRTPPPVRG